MFCVGTIARSIRDELPDGLIRVGEVTICVREKLSIMSLIRASVDALCRDGAGLISRERVQRGRLTRQGTRS